MIESEGIVAPIGCIHTGGLAGESAGPGDLQHGGRVVRDHAPLPFDPDSFRYTGPWNLDLGAGGLEFFYPYAEEKGLLGHPGLRHAGFAAGEITGNAGNDLFRHFVLYLDYPHDHVIVEKGADFATDFPTDRSGLQLLLGDDGRMFAYTVAEGTPAAHAGIKEGDVVTAIDGKDLQAIGGIAQARELFRTPTGSRCALELLRDGKPVHLTIVLGDLYR